jgi:hypothetical protein
LAKWHPCGLRTSARPYIYQRLEFLFVGDHPSETLKRPTIKLSANRSFSSDGAGETSVKFMPAKKKKQIPLSAVPEAAQQSVEPERFIR